MIQEQTKLKVADAPIIPRGTNKRGYKSPNSIPIISETPAFITTKAALKSSFSLMYSNPISAAIPNELYCSSFEVMNLMLPPK